MTKKSKLATPTWIMEGYDSPAAYAKAKGETGKKKSGHRSVYPKEGRVPLRGPQLRNEGARIFKVRRCPKCDSDDVGVVLSGSDAEEGGGKEWECRKCGWKGSEVKKEELTEDEFMKYMDESPLGVYPKGTRPQIAECRGKGEEVA
ncbi:MAG: hypothetical protein KJ721_01265 [Nanoarchaeota archaeon]|nr:hypothetical protein [Nanoarchaeota archaeon]